MQAPTSPPSLSLRTKLVLSYIAVIVGAVLALSFAVSWAVRDYVTRAQLNDLREGRGPAWAEKYEHDFLRMHGEWSLVQPPDDPSLLMVIYDSSGNQIFCAQPNHTQNSCDTSIIKRAQNQALSGEQNEGNITIATGQGEFSSPYISRPLMINHNIIGAMFLAQTPLSLSQGFSDLMGQINQAIFIAGGIIALLALLLSLFLARGLTRPLIALTTTAEQMKRGQYTKRVQPPKTQDEIGRLALTFNAMADTIESDVNELRRQDQMRRDLIANIAHDLATPLTAIQGFSEALADEVISEPAARHETAQRIGREVQRLRRLVAEVRQMTQLEAGRLPLDLAPLDIHALVDETLFVLEPECQQAEITLHNEIATTIPHVSADSDRIAQVLLNLLDNARRYTPKGGTITVGAQPEDGYLRVWVSDTGSGIAAADLPHIFERFYRADRSRTGATGGSGLGLSIVRAIIAAHGGTISAESTPGRGTQITFTLPLAERRTPTGTLIA